VKNSRAPNLIKIGKVMEPRALKGELKIHLFSGEAPWIDSVKNLFLKIKDEPVSHGITSAIQKGTQLIVKLKGMNDRTMAEKWVGAEVWISEDHFNTKPGENFYLREILGFKVFANENEIGIIVDFDSNGSQDLIVVENAEKKKILIPLIKEFIIKIDNAKKMISMNLPEGLLEVNS
jgi:16S rRNA processing protein RimM